MLDKEESQAFKQLLEVLSQQKTYHHFKLGEIIPQDNESIWVICQGFVQVVILQASGDESIIGLLGPVMSLSRELNFLYSYQAIALSKVEMLRLSSKEIKGSPALQNILNTQLVRRLRQTEALLVVANKRHIVDRLRGLLYLLAYEFGQRVAEGVRIEVRLSHQQMANAVGTTRVTATRTLGQLQKQGIFDIGEDRHIYIPLVSESEVIAALCS